MELENHDLQRCQDFIAWLGQRAGRPLNAQIAAHPHGCLACRGRLLLVTHAIQGIDPQPPISCGQCEAQLGAFVERELAHIEQAWRWYPAVWQHLWTCEKCLDSYDMLHQSLSDPALQLPDLARQPGLPGREPGAGKHLLDLMYAAIIAVLHPIGPLPAYRSAVDGAPFEVLEPTLCTDGDISCRIDVAFHDARTCRLIVQLDPAQTGTVVLHGATAALTAPLDNSEAVISLPLQDLIDHDGSHFALVLLPDR